jgi:heme a synthase
MNFRKLGLWTIAAVYFLIFVGGVVRATGSGMGCPDWPKCFGRWLPPTEVSQLPPNYKEIFGAKLKGEVEFNAFKTWTEYVNRLIGVLIGFLIFGTLLASIPYLRKDNEERHPIIFYLSFLSFILVAFQGWLGSKVVAAELKPTIVTLHMMLAIVIVFLLLYVVAMSFTGTLKAEKIQNKSFLNKILIATLIVSLMQIIFGTQVREAVDDISKAFGEVERNSWIDNLGNAFIIHRSFSWVVLGLNIFLIYSLRKNSEAKSLLNNFGNYLVGLIFIEFLVGIVMAKFAIPPIAQPIHLTLGTLAVGIQFVMLLFLNREKVFVNFSPKINLS